MMVYNYRRFPNFLIFSIVLRVGVSTFVAKEKDIMVISLGAILTSPLTMYILMSQCIYLYVCNFKYVCR